MKFINYAGILSAILLLSGCFASSPEQQGARIDEVTMYGGMDRSKVARLKEADETFISGVTKEFGSKEKAAVIFVNAGYKFYKQDQPSMAMRRFNQAWLLDPNNPEVFTGFAAVLHGYRLSCESMKMMEKALALNPPMTRGIYPDAARVITLCAVDDKTLSVQAKSQLFERSEELYKKAEASDPHKDYLYSSWAEAYYWREQYPEAWMMVAKTRAAGGKPSENFLNMLKAKMPEQTAE